MTPSLPFVVAVFAAPAADLPTELRQVAPEVRVMQAAVQRSKDRAVVIIPGLRIHPIRPSNATRPDRREYQEPTSELVKALAKDSDVFAFAYAQTVPLDAVAQSPGLRAAVAQLKEAGYTEIVLIGHSAGGVIARLFGENYPDSGVTKVITVAAPHAGSDLAKLKVGYPRVQAPFVQSLSPDSRGEVVHAKLDDRIEMACVVCKLKRVDADGLVTTPSQWPADCRKLGIPAVLCVVNHWDAMSDSASIKTIAELAREKLARWSPEEVEKARKVLFGEPEPRPNRFRRR
jgi:hypothetical protein